MSVSTRNTVAWILQALLAFAFTASGISKFLHLDEAVKGFISMGFPGWMLYLIASAEVLGGIGLLLLRFVRPAALGLIIIMIGAVYLHATKIPGGLAKGVPALVLLVLLVVVLVLRRPTTLAA
ncbi:DoxX family membrane protein [Hymenobacter sp. HMF4947]|uniref:DoxX family membrane protein n=1 Tax=Hymenobacter ginkgonis TaxID=2682976 RepID=A0A7K1TA32_9BACT|nr:DoxX family protein [Hymenobacter ginkgonis]MVN75243.1 DoxX family membrane protein [Hymenobacter ginkgonis]